MVPLSNPFIFIFFLFCFVYPYFNECSSQMHCEHGFYFDSISLNCTSCPGNQTFDGMRGCSCPPRFIKLNSNCIECPNEHVSSSDGKACVRCPADASFSRAMNYCTKCINDTVLVEKLQNGTRLQQLQCLPCSSGTLPDHKKGICSPCHESFLTENKCYCPNKSIVLDGKCVPLSELSDIPDRESSYTIPYISGNLRSNFLKYNYRAAAHGCRFKHNKTSCQILANMCTLLHFSYDNELNACSFYRSYLSSNLKNVPNYAPELYFRGNDATSILLNTDISSVFSFKKNMINNFLNLTVSKYSPNGHLVGYGPVEKYLDICPHIQTNFVRILSFGKTSSIKCTLPVKKIFKDHNTYFYEIFLNYADEETGLMKRYSLPILNKNFKYQNSFPNTKSLENWQLVKRFFVFDTLSRSDHMFSSISNDPTVIRYLSNIEIMVNLRSDSMDGLIYPPLIILSYNEVQERSIRDGSSSALTLKVTYSSDQINNQRDLSIAMAVMCIFAVLWSLIETYSWGKRCGKVGIDLSGVFKLILISCGNLANVLFLVLFCTCLYWSMIFKGQDVVYLLLPSGDQEYSLKNYLISAFILKSVHVCYMLYEQMTIDLFFIDWEKPRAKHTIPHPQLSKKKGSGELANVKISDSVSIWRIYFVANEWNEIQTLRKTNIYFQLTAMLFVLKVLNLEGFTTYDPNNEFYSEAPSMNSPYSFVCRFSLSVSMFLFFIGIQLVFRGAFYERYIENKLQQFVDLCSMANISLFILQQPLYGYYIHGRSVHGFADSDMKTFYENLQREEEDLCAYRGLESSSDCQTFEVITTYNFRDEYSNILKFTSDPSNVAQQHYHNPRRTKINAWKVDQTVQSHERMKSFFEMFLQHSSPNVDYIIKDKLFLENILDIELQDVNDKCLFFRDPNFLFNRVLYYGQESMLLTFEIMLFTFIDLLYHDFVLSAITTYSVYFILKKIRNSGGRRNLVKKTLVDQRFLI